jgi:glycyl-tRNA synthetase beta chain
MQVEASHSLVEANKRIGNILRKSDYETGKGVFEDRLVIDEERRLFAEINNISEQLESLYEERDYKAGLALLLGLSDSTNAFFDKVMVMDEDLDTRHNRLELLAKLKGMFDQVANLALIG